MMVFVNIYIYILFQKNLVAMESTYVAIFVVSICSNMVLK